MLDLKQNNNFRNLDTHIVGLINKITNHYISIIAYLNNENRAGSKLHFLKLSINENNIIEIIQTLLDSTYFHGHFSFDFSKLYYSLIDLKTEQADQRLKNRTKRFRLDLFRNELNKLIEYEEPGKIYLSTPNLASFLKKEMRKLEQEIGYFGKINYQFTRYDNHLKKIHNLLFAKGFISSDKENFIRVLENQEGKINWEKAKLSLIQFLAIIQKHTTILDDVKFNEFICQYFLLNGKAITDISRATQSHKKDLVAGIKQKEDYRTLIKVLSYIPDEYIK